MDGRTTTRSHPYPLGLWVSIPPSDSLATLSLVEAVGPLATRASARRKAQPRLVLGDGKPRPILRLTDSRGTGASGSWRDTSREIHRQRMVGRAGHSEHGGKDGNVTKLLVNNVTFNCCPLPLLCLTWE